MKVMQDQNTSPVRTMFGVLSVLLIVYGLYSLGSGVWLLISAAKAPALPPATDAAAKAGQEIGSALGASFTMFAAELGVMRGILCCFVGLGGLITLSALDTMEQTKFALGHVWRELAAKNQTP
jgi:hypothetical protein